MTGTGAVPTAHPISLFAWVNAATAAQQGSRFFEVNDGTASNRFSLGTDSSAATGKAQARMDAGTLNSAAISTVAGTNGAWQFQVATFGPYPNNANAYLAGTNKGSKTGIITPAGLTSIQIGGRGTQQEAHHGLCTRVLGDLEVAACALGLVNPRVLAPQHLYYVNSATTETDLTGSINLTVTGTAAGSSDPQIATWFTGTAIPNQSWTQGVAITSIDLTTKFDNGVAATAPWAGTLKQLGAAGTPTSANGAQATPSMLLTTNAPLTANQWVKIGSNALTPVLYVSGNTALIQAAQTWNDADTVTPFPVTTVAAITGNGVTVNGSNSLGGTPGAGAVGSFSNCCCQATNNSSGAISYSNLFNIAVASSAATPSFSAGPTLTNATTDGYVFGATSNQTATWYTCVLLQGSPTLVGNPTGVRTGSPTGFVSRFSAALTASVAGAQTVTALTLPLHDVYHVLNNGSGDSAVVANAALFKLPPAGKQYVTAALISISAISKANPVQITTSAPHGRTTGNWVEVFGAGGMTQINGAWGQCTVVDATHLTIPGIDSTLYSTYTSGGNVTWGRSSFAGSSVPVVSGDILMADVADGQGNAVTFTPEGVASFATNSTARQSFTKDVYDISGGAFIGSAADYENDSPPIVPGDTGLPSFVVFPLNQQFSAPIAGYATDPQGDNLTSGITALTALPPGRTLSAGVLSGIATANGVTPVTFQAQNASGESSTFVLAVVDGGITVPRGLGLQQSDADALINATYLDDQFGSQDDATPGGPAPAGQVIAQTPPPDTVVAPGTVVVFTLSTGRAPITEVLVPDVSSTPTDQATATAVLAAAGFTVVVPQPWMGVKQITQYPTAGSLLVNGSVVSLFLQGGTPRIVRPRKRMKKKEPKNLQRAVAPSPAPYILRRPKRR